jgi:RNA polymerase sigma-70 factor, ECF subfamily
MQFDEMYRQNYQQVYRLAKKIVHDDEASRDIAQEIFCKLLHSINQGVQFIHPENWLSRITINHCFNHIRDSKKTSGSVRINKDVIEELIDPKQPDSEAIRLEETKKIYSKMLQLKEKERLLVTLYSEGMSYKEIAEISGMPFASVGKTLTRSLLKLKKLCNEH